MRFILQSNSLPRSAWALPCWRHVSDCPAQPRPGLSISQAGWVRACCGVSMPSGSGERRGRLVSCSRAPFWSGKGVTVSHLPDSPGNAPRWASHCSTVRAPRQPGCALLSTRGQDLAGGPQSCLCLRWALSRGPRPVCQLCALGEAHYPGIFPVRQQPPDSGPQTQGCSRGY